MGRAFVQVVLLDLENMQQNERSVATLGFDTAEIEPSKVWHHLANLAKFCKLGQICNVKPAELPRRHLSSDEICSSKIGSESGQ
jgi:hypothetical protein